MSKISNILRLINLLNNRQGVTLNHMSQYLSVSHRTIYRYLNILSEANIPVYFDKDSNTHRLTSRLTIRFDDTGVGDITLIVFSLHFLSLMVNQKYNSQIKELIQRTIIRQQHPLESILASIERIVVSTSVTQDLSAALSQALLMAALRCQRRVRVTAPAATGPASSRQEVDVSLLFKDEWNIVDKHDEISSSVAFANVEAVDII